MRHFYIKAGEKVDWNQCKIIHEYPDFVTFDQARQNHAANDPFWQEVNQYMLDDMEDKDNREKMSSKYHQKQKGNIKSVVWVGLIRKRAIVVIKPGAPKSAVHYYLFFRGADDEIDTEIGLTFS